MMMPPTPDGRSRRPLALDRDALAPARSQSRSGWYLASGMLLVLVGLAVWMDHLLEGSEQRPDPERNQPAVALVADGGEHPGDPVAVPFGAERCVPWHVSAGQGPLPAGTRTLVLTSRLVDPFGYTLGGFEQECGPPVKVLVIEDLLPGALAQAVAEGSPVALVAVGLDATRRAKQEAPQVPLFYAMVQTPLAAGLDQTGAYGVLPWVPAGPLVRHLLRVLPRSHTTIAVLHPPGPLADLATEAARAIEASGKRPILIPVPTADGLEERLDQAAAEAQAWLVLPDPALIDHKLFNRIQIAAERRAVPLCVPDEEHVRAGAYAGVGIDSERIGRQLCRLAGAGQRGNLPAGGQVYCPEYSFVVLHNALLEKLGYSLDPDQFQQAKLYKWH